MGGNALKTLHTPRLPKDQYKVVEKDVVEKLSKHCDELFIYRYFKDKSTFGDIDVFVLNMDDSHKVIDDNFHPEEVVLNGNTYNFDYTTVEGGKFQIDLKLCDSKTVFETTKLFKSYSDFAMIMGRMCTLLGVKFGEMGMWYNVHLGYKKENPFIGKVTLSQDPYNITDFFGFPREFVKEYILEGSGESSLLEIDMFDMLYSSTIMNTNESHKINNGERPMCHRFMEYLLGKRTKTPSIDTKYVLEYFGASGIIKTLHDDYEETRRKVSKCKEIFRSLEMGTVSGEEKGKLYRYLKTETEFKNPEFILETPKDILQSWMNYYIKKLD